MNLGRIFPFAFLASLALAGCDSQVDPDYRGEPLATVHGSVAAESQAPAAGDAVLVWQNPAGSPDLAIGVSTPVTGSFPASFTMPIYEPPPEAAVIYSPEDTGDDRVAVGIIAMIKHGADLATLQSNDDAVLGMCEDHVVVYIENEIQAGGLWEKLLNGRPAPGYHLMEVVRKTPAELEAIQACNEAYENAINACYEACDAAPSDACYEDCDTSVPLPSCGSGHDTFREAADDFGASITVKAPATQGIDWF